MKTSVILKGFSAVQPPYHRPQEEGFQWLVEAHARAATTFEGREDSLQEWRDRISRMVRRYNCAAEHIGRRRSDLEDFMHTDFLEHVEQPAQVVSEAARVLAPGGLFFFHTFSRNLLSWLIVIKGVEWFVRNTPQHMHCLSLFIKPTELRRMCANTGLRIDYFRGLAPAAWKSAFWKMIFTGRVCDDFTFIFSPFTMAGYAGLAVKVA